MVYFTLQPELLRCLARVQSEDLDHLMMYKFIPTLSKLKHMLPKTQGVPTKGTVPSDSFVGQTYPSLCDRPNASNEVDSGVSWGCRTSKE